MKNKKGFTLIELLIVIAIIGILASIVLVSLSSARQKAKVASYKAQVHSVQAAAIMDCDSNATMTMTEPASNSYIGVLGVTSSNCGVSGAGTFTINTEATGTGVAACETADSTVINQNGVTFPTGC